MFFRDINKELPKENELVLIKSLDNYLPYYVCRFCKIGYDMRFEEAGGEQYSWWDISEVEGWMPLNELNQISVLYNKES